MLGDGVFVVLGVHGCGEDRLRARWLFGMGREMREVTVRALRVNLLGCAYS